MPFVTRRNFLSASARTAAALTAGSFLVVEAAQSQTDSAARTPVDQALDTFIESYTKAMNSPGLTLGTANRAGTVRVASYGFSNPGLKQAQLARSSFMFGRAKNENAKEKDKPAPVVELMHGSGWYTNSKYTGPKTFTVPPEYAAFTGTYLCYGPFEGTSADIVVLKGELWAEGETSLERIGENEFRPTEDTPNPERVEFLFVVNGKARLLKFSGADFFRFEGE
jgi:hypothetical protein